MVPSVCLRAYVASTHELTSYKSSPELRYVSTKTSDPDKQSNAGLFYIPDWAHRITISSPYEAMAILLRVS